MFSVDLEMYQVLRCVSQDREVEELVHWQIPYERVLRLMLRAIKEDLLEEGIDGLVLTDAGRAVLVGPPPEPKLHLRADSLARHTRPATDPEAVHVPAKELL